MLYFGFWGFFLTTNFLKIGFSLNEFLEPGDRILKHLGLFSVSMKHQAEFDDFFSFWIIYHENWMEK